MGIVIGSCVPDDEPEATDRFHHVVYGKRVCLKLCWQNFVVKVLSILQNKNTHVNAFVFLSLTLSLSVFRL